LRAEKFADLIDQVLVKRIDLRIHQRPIVGSVRNFVRQTLFTFRNRGTEVLVEYLNMLNQRLVKLLDPTNDLLRGERAIHHNGKVPLDGRKTRKGTGRYFSRSILKQLLEVKFKDQKGRQSKLLLNARMNLTERAHV
jgi:hypothetical protein